MRNIGRHSAEAENWAEAANYAIQEQHEAEATRRHQELIRMFSRVGICDKAEREVRSYQVLRNPKFFGREDVLLDMSEHLRPRQVPKSQDRLRSYTLHGLGGVGKTQTATEYLYRSLDQFSAVFWFRAETQAILRQELTDAAGKVAVIPEGQTPDIAASIASFQAWLLETGNSVPWTAVIRI